MKKSAFNFKKPEESPGFLLWQVTTAWQQEIKFALEPYKVSHSQFVIMAVLLWFEEHDQLPIQNDIISKTLLDKMTVSKELKKLVSAGFVDRSESLKDTRAKTVSLNKKGKKLAEKLVGLVERLDGDFFGVLDASEQEVFLRKLNALVGIRVT